MRQVIGGLSPGIVTEGLVVMSLMPENAALIFPNVLRGEAMVHMTGSRDQAVRHFNEMGAHRAARIIQKGPVGATSTVDSDTAVMYGAWSQSMATPSIFYKLFNEGFFRKFPMYQRMAFFATSPTAAVNLEGRAAALSRVVVNNLALQPWMIATLIAVTKEMLFDPGAEAAFNKELKAKTAERVDGALLELLFDGTGSVTIPSSGSTPQDAVNDIRAAGLALGTIGDASRLVWIASPDVAWKASALGAEGGGTFPSMTPGGGQIRGVNCLISNGVPAGSAMLLDAAQIGAADDGTVGSTTNQADLEMSDDPVSDAVTPTATSLVSAWQSNLVAMKLVATISAARLRDAGAVLLTDVDWGGT
jgi:hypothetical protein